MTIKIKLTVSDYVDERPQSDVLVRARVRVAQLHVVIRGGKPRFEPKGGEMTPSQRTRTDAQGVAEFIVDADEAFARQGALMEDDTAVGAFPELVFSAAGINRSVQLSTKERGEAKNASLEYVAHIDFAHAIVGATDDTSFRLWLRRFGNVDPERDRHVLEVRRKGAISRVPLQSHQVTFNAERAQTAVADVRGLEPGRDYSYALRLRQESPGGNAPAPSSRILASGEVRTDDAAATATALRFGSCHAPTWPGQGSQSASLERWSYLSDRPSADALLLMGDQIYGDDVKPDASDGYREGYVRQYTRYWIHRQMRDVLRRTPTYMMWDDHEVSDDWGSALQPAGDDARRRISDATWAYGVFQQAHNPGGFEVGDEGPFHYHFRRGPMAVFVLDERSRRGMEDAHPVLGQAQFDALRDWARSPATLEADFLVLASPVPLAFVDAEDLQRLRGELLRAASTFGLSLLAGPMAGAAGYFGSEHIADRIGVGRAAVGTEYDLDDQWTTNTNRGELAAVLDIMFDAANEGDGRALFFLGGDAHIGALHFIHSQRHARSKINGAIQLLSSPISHPPPDDDIFRYIVESIGQGKSWVEVAAELTVPNMTKTPSRFFLDAAKNYRAKVRGLVTDRNVGLIRVLRQPGERRLYRVLAALDAASRGLHYSFELDLDDPYVSPRGERVARVTQH